MVGACRVQIPTLATAGLTIQEHTVKVNTYFLAAYVIFHSMYYKLLQKRNNNKILTFSCNASVLHYDIPI